MWGEGPLDGEDGPDIWQADVLRELGEQCKLQRLVTGRNPSLKHTIQVAVASGHGVGKTALVAWIIKWFYATRPTPAGTITAGTASQLQTKTWRELKKWNDLSLDGELFSWTKTRFALKADPEKHCANAIPWSKERSDSFAGLHEKYVLVIYDEASTVDNVIWETTEGALTTSGCIWIVFGNPFRNDGRFADCFGKFRSRWWHKKVDARSAKHANQAKIKEWIEDYGIDSDFVRVRALGEFPRAGFRQFISAEEVERAQARSNEVHYGVARVLGVDVARFGECKTVIARRIGGVVEPLIKRRGLSVVEVAAEVSLAIREFSPDIVFIDGGAMGPGVVDILHQQGHKDIVHEVLGQNKPDPENEQNVANKRAECWYRMRQWLVSGQLPEDQELASEMTGVQYGFDGKGRIQLERKEDILDRGQDSPDCPDAVSLTFAFETAPRRDLGYGYQLGALPDYEPAY